MSWSQTALDSTRRRLERAPLHPLRALKRLMPRRLFGRSLMIIVIPMLLLQAVVLGHGSKFACSVPSLNRIRVL